MDMRLQLMYVNLYEWHAIDDQLKLRFFLSLSPSLSLSSLYFLNEEEA